MADLNNFDANAVKPNMDFQALPAGRYEAMIVESTLKPTASGTGEYLELVLTVLGGSHDGATLFDRLNLKNPSEKAVQIARGQLSSICRAVGVLTPRDSTQLHNLPLIVRVGTREHEGRTYNDVKAYYPKDGAAKAATPDAAPVAAPSNAPPWAKK